MRLFLSSMTNCCSCATVCEMSVIFFSYSVIVDDANWATDCAWTARCVASTACCWVESIFSRICCDSCSLAFSYSAFAVCSWSNVLSACSWIFNPISITERFSSAAADCCITCNCLVSCSACSPIYCALLAVILDYSCITDCSPIRISNSLATDAVRFNVSCTCTNVCCSSCFD